MTFPCSAKGCIAIVDAVGDLCAVHLNQCSLCGYAKHRHPVVYMDPENGPITKCYEFQRQGMKPYEPKWDGQFNSFSQWVNRASSWLVRAGYKAKCFDKNGRPCLIGADFQHARDTDAFPVFYRFEVTEES